MSKKDYQSTIVDVLNGQSTTHNGPFELVYVDECLDVKEAKEIEKFLKSGQGRQCLNELGI